MLSFTPAISHDMLWSIFAKRNLYLGPLYIIDQNLESVIISNPQWLYDQHTDSNTKSPYNLKRQE